MKRFILSFIAVVTAFFTLTSFTVAGSTYTATPPSKNGATSLKSNIPYRTDFTVENNSSAAIYARVAGGTRQMIPSGFHTDFQSNAVLPDPTIIIEDNAQNTIYYLTVCRYALVSIYGHPGSYQMSVDSSRC